MHTHMHAHANLSPLYLIHADWTKCPNDAALCLFLCERKRAKVNVTQLQLFHLQSDNTRCCRLALCAICPAWNCYLFYINAQWCSWCIYFGWIRTRCCSICIPDASQNVQSSKVKHKVLTRSSTAAFVKVNVRTTPGFSHFKIWNAVWSSVWTSFFS